MKEESKNRKITIDFINMLVGIAVIVVAVFAFMNDKINYKLFPVLFFLGTIMLVLNAVKYFVENKILGIIYGFLSIIMIATLILSLVKLI